MAVFWGIMLAWVIPMLVSVALVVILIIMGDARGVSDVGSSFLQLVSIGETRCINIFRSTLYNPAMNKRARKRLKEAIEKKNLERQKMLKEQSSPSSQTKERRGFTVKPEKKRG